jgi:disulfide bond formation protein DsbB
MTVTSISSISRPHPAVTAALIVAAGGIATILGAYFFQYVLDVKPCDLCLLQRKVYYAAIPLALIVAFVVSRQPPRSVVTGALALLAVAMLVGAAIAVYHSGVEWKFWAGPQDCTGELGNFSGGDILDLMNKTKLVRCDQPTRYFGVSLANANIVISLVLAAAAVWGIRAERAKS